MTRERETIQPCAPGESAYEILDEDAGAPAIRFWPCGVVSHNPHDVKERYCGVCHRFIAEELF